MNRLPALLFLVSVVGCGPQDAAVSLPADFEPGSGGLAAPGIPDLDRATSVEALSWNVEWFGDVENGPSDEAKQQANVRAALGAMNADLVGLSEVVSAQAFDALVAGLPGYQGLLVSDPRVVGGSAQYSASEQKVALLFKSRFRIESAQVVLREASYQFAGRPPMEVHLAFEEGGRPRTLVVLVAHFKAMANLDGYTRRLAAAKALKTYLDGSLSTRWVLVMGDLNDDIDVSTYRAKPSPFAPFVSDAAQYRFTTDALTTSGTSTTVHFSATIDHHLATDELAKRFIEGSAQVQKLDAFIPGYGDGTSDHYPVLTRYDLR